MISIILNVLLWFLIIPDSTEEIKIKGFIIGLSYALLVLAPLSRWMFPKNFKMQDGMMLQLMSSLFVTIINYQSLGITG